jgi:hypothetical protein
VAFRSLTRFGSSPLRRFAAAVGLFGVSVALVLGGWVAGRRATKTPKTSPAKAAPPSILSRYGTLEETRDLAVQAQWRADRTIFNRLSGTITSMQIKHEAIQEVDAGSVIYSVDGRSVLILEGARPAYRDIGSGSSGDDVRQIQTFLATFNSSSLAVDGIWGSETLAEWNRWRRIKGLEIVDNGVSLGEVVFVPSLPRRVVAAEGMDEGRVVSGAEVIGTVEQAAPTFWIDQPKTTAAPLAPGVRVDVVIGAETVSALVSTRRTSTEQGDRLELDLPATRCNSCSVIQGTQPSPWPGIARMTPPVSGTIVPVGALRSATGPESAVVLEDGTVRAVKVLSRVGAEVVIDGIGTGVRVLLPSKLQ